MANYGEWNQKGGSLSQVTAKKEYGVEWDFILKGIQSGKLEYKENSMHGNPYVRILRSQLERYIFEELGADYLTEKKKETEILKIDKEIKELRAKLKNLERLKEILQSE
jgi:hypothetical protein